MTDVLYKPVADTHAPATGREVNPWLKTAAGNAGGWLLLRGFSGNRPGALSGAPSTGAYLLDMQAANGKHLAVLLSATSATATPSAANSALLVDDAGVTVGPAFTVTGDLTASGNLKWKSGTAFTATLDHAMTADRTITVPDATDTLALLGRTQAFTGQNTFSNATAPIIAAKIGPNNTQQHALPAVASDTVALLGAAQTFTGALTLNGSLVFPSGTWTPSLGGTATYTARDGAYVKIGRVVFIWGFVSVNLIGTGSTTTISGLPVATDFNDSPIAATKWASLAVAPVTLSFRVSGSTLIADGLTAAGATSGTPTIFGNGATTYFAGSYRAAS